ncbi:MAG TPA: hypothetical protein VM934_12880 [Pyrinomonadaceae bacterium]|jgi:hypothetical protein|nr:hypothetical protein [Pyrinomonadaceae bacterium]
MNTKKIYSALAAIILVAATAFGAIAAPAAVSDKKEVKREAAVEPRVSAPLNLAILIQDDLVSRVGSEIKLTREFIRTLPAGSRVLVGYIRSGSLQVRQPFTTDLERAAQSLRIPAGTTAVSAFNPYVEVREALKSFPEAGQNRNALLLISDGLDTSRGFDFSSTVNSIDLERAVREANRRGVAIYSFYAPSAGLTSRNRQAVSFGQSALNRISNETGGKAFFQGTSFVTFNAYFENFSKTLNRQSGGAY